jgi:DNA topoisomerase-2
VVSILLIVAFSLDMEDDDSDDSAYLKPAKKTKTQMTDFFDKVPGPSGAEKKVTNRKASGSTVKPVPKKPAKKAVESDEDDDNTAGDGSPVVPARAAPKRAARATAKKYIEVLSDSDEDSGGGGDSMFLDDDDD